MAVYIRNGIQTILLHGKSYRVPSFSLERPPFFQLQAHQHDVLVHSKPSGWLSSIQKLIFAFSLDRAGSPRPVRLGYSRRLGWSQSLFSERRRHTCSTKPYPYCHPPEHDPGEGLLNSIEQTEHGTPSLWGHKLSHTQPLIPPLSTFISYPFIFLLHNCIHFIYYLSCMHLFILITKNRRLFHIKFSDNNGIEASSSASHTTSHFSCSTSYEPISMKLGTLM